MLRNFCLITTIFCFSSLLPFPVKAASPKPIPRAVMITATLGEPKLSLFGYTSPYAKVEVKGNRVAEETMADSTGYFYFNQVFLPQPDPDYPEICLTAIDTKQRLSFPTCLPFLPTGPVTIQIGPVLLAPTISLEKGNFLSGEQITARGSTVPKSEVNIFLAYQGHSFPFFSFIPPAYAHPLPQYQIRSDENGYFEFNLPAFQPATWRVFAAVSHLDSPSPKSNTLTFKILSWWQLFIERLKAALGKLLDLCKPYSLPILLIVISLIIWFWWKRRSTKTNLHLLGKNAVIQLRFNKIISRLKGRNIKNGPTKIIRH
jgi:hypothetical protein